MQCGMYGPSVYQRVCAPICSCLYIQGTGSRILGTTVRRHISAVGGCPVHWRISGSISGLHPLDASRSPSPRRDNQKCLRALPDIPQGGAKSPPVENPWQSSPHLWKELKHWLPLGSGTGCVGDRGKREIFPYMLFCTV